MRCDRLSFSQLSFSGMQNSVIVNTLVSWICRDKHSLVALSWNFTSDTRRLTADTKSVLLRMFSGSAVETRHALSLLGFG